MKILYRILAPLCNILTVLGLKNAYPDLNIELSWVNHRARMHLNTGDKFWNVPLLRLLFENPPMFFLISVHEVGHCLSEDGFNDDVILAEWAAWDWALDRIMERKHTNWGLTTDHVRYILHYYGSYCLHKDNITRSEGGIASMERLLRHHIQKVYERNA